MNFNCINKHNCNKKIIKLHMQTKYTWGHFLSTAYVLQNFEENYSHTMELNDNRLKENKWNTI